MKLGRIVASVTIENATDLSKTLRCEALVDTGASLMVLPRAWKDRLGNFESSTEIEVETATQEAITAEVCGPVRIQIEGFRHIFNEVRVTSILMFVDGELSLPETDGTVNTSVTLMMNKRKPFGITRSWSGDSVRQTTQRFGTFSRGSIRIILHSTIRSSGTHVTGGGSSKPQSGWQITRYFRRLASSQQEISGECWMLSSRASFCC